MMRPVVLVIVCSLSAFTLHASEITRVSKPYNVEQKPLLVLPISLKPNAVNEAIDFSEKVKSTPAVASMNTKSYTINVEDGTLRQALNRICTEEKWDLVWKSGVDIELDAGGTFTGTFEGALTEILQTFQGADVVLRAGIFTENNVLVITEQGKRFN